MYVLTKAYIFKEKQFQITFFKARILFVRAYGHRCALYVNTDRKTDRTKQWPYQKLDLLCTGKEKVSSNLHLYSL
jgi:hypothetical protein